MPAWPEEPRDDEAYAPTPTTLPELIEGVGLEAVDWDVWTVVLQDGEPLGHERAHAFLDGELLIFTEYVQIPRQEIYASIWFYTTDGKLLEVRSWDRERVRGGFAPTGDWWLQAIYQDAAVTLSTLRRTDGTFEVRELVFEPFQDVVAVHLLPLVYRYHIENGHERFELALTGSLLGNNKRHGLRRYENIGSEQNAVDGVLTPCVVFQVEAAMDPEDGFVDGNIATSYIVVTASGQLVSEWYDDRPPESDGVVRSPPEELPPGFRDVPEMLEGDIGNDVFGEVEVRGDEGQEAAE